MHYYGVKANFKTVRINRETWWDRAVASRGGGQGSSCPPPPPEQLSQTNQVCGWICSRLIDLVVLIVVTCNNCLPFSWGRIQTPLQGSCLWHLRYAPPPPSPITKNLATALWNGLIFANNFIINKCQGRNCCFSVGFHTVLVKYVYRLSNYLIVTFIKFRVLVQVEAIVIVTMSKTTSATPLFILAWKIWEETLTLSAIKYAVLCQ